MKYSVLIAMMMILTGCVNTKLQALKDKNAEEIQLLKGDPVTKIHEHGGEMWTYRQNMCTELVFFDATGRVEDLYELGECSVSE